MMREPSWVAAVRLRSLRRSNSALVQPLLHMHIILNILIRFSVFPRFRNDILSPRRVDYLSLLGFYEPETQTETKMWLLNAKTKQFEEFF